MTNKWLLFAGVALALVIVIAGIVLVGPSGSDFVEEKDNNWWAVQSIDAVKYSRDLAREKLSDISFDETIELQVKRIAETGATHISIGTPYDKEFLPFLARWVRIARKYDLNIWFRGNLSGWEGWFGYKKITWEEHIALTREFILDNGELFEDGDIFSACTECENGGPGDPRQTGDIKGHRQFLLDEYRTTKSAFRAIGKSVAANYNPMNGDVAKVIMDVETTKALGGIVVIDHYVRDPEQLSRDVVELADSSGGKVVLGEFGAPIPAIHGQMSKNQQARWLERALNSISTIPQLAGVNYWTGFGGSSRLWNSEGQARPAVSELTKFYSPRVIKGYIRNELGRPIEGAKLSGISKAADVGKNGEFYFLSVSDNLIFKATAPGYLDREYTFGDQESEVNVVLVKENENLIFKIQKFLYR